MFLFLVFVSFFFYFFIIPASMVQSRRQDWAGDGSLAPHITISLQICKSLVDSPIDIWLTPGGIGLHGIYGKNIPNSRDFERGKWNPHFDEDLKYALMECWKNYAKNPDSESSSSHREHQVGFWKRNYKIHSGEVKMTQEEYLNFGIQKFKLLKDKVSTALYESSSLPIRGLSKEVFPPERRKLDVKKFLSSLSSADANSLDVFIPTLVFRKFKYPKPVPKEKEEEDEPVPVPKEKEEEEPTYMVLKDIKFFLSYEFYPRLDFMAPPNIRVGENYPDTCWI